MQPSPRAVAVGVDLGSSTITVSTRRGDRRAEPGEAGAGTTRFEASRAGGATRPYLPADASVLVALAVPATWSSTRRRAHVEAAANAGFDASFLVSEPEAAARQYAENQGREADSPLVVCNIGAGSCHVGVVRCESGLYTVEAARSADDIGGREFDRLLLEHLAGRHRQTDPEFWARAGDPAETALRAEALEEVRRAREYLTDHPSVTVSLPGLDRDLRLTREDADQCLTPAILRTVGLIEDAMRDAAVEAGEVAGLMLVGGVSRMPLVAQVFGHHLGIEPVRPDLPDLVIAEGAALAGLDRIRSASGESPGEEAGFARLRTSPDVLVTVMVVVIAVASFVGVALLSRGGPATEDIDGAAGADPTPGVIGEAASAETLAAPTASEEPGEPAASEPAASTKEATVSAAATSASPSAPASSATPYAPAGSTQPESAATVPDVVGETVAEARRLLAAAGFHNVAAQGERRGSGGQEYGDCEVTAQTPGGGSVSEQDAAVELEYVYVGNDSC